MDSHEVNYVTMMGSAAHTYGNALANVQKFIIDLFEPHFFKTIHVQSKIAHRQMLSTPEKWINKMKPLVAFNPRVNYDEQRFLDGTLLTHRLTDVYTKSGASDLQPFFNDPHNKLMIKYALDRYVLNIDVLFEFSTAMQQINIMHFLKNMLKIDIPFDIPTYLESYLGVEMMEYLSGLCGIPIKDENGSVKNFIDYMNSCSAYPITYKLNTAKGKDEFFRYYNPGMIATISNLEASDGDRRGMVGISYNVNMTMKLEFYGTGFYYLFSDKIHNLPKISAPDDGSLIPIFTDVIMKEDLKLPPGWQVFSHFSCQLTKQNDDVQFDGVLNQSIKEVIEFHLQKGYPLFNAINIRIRKQGELIQEGIDYDIDFVNYRINFHNTDYSLYSYTIIISIDVRYINNLIKEEYNLK